MYCYEAGPEDNKETSIKWILTPAAFMSLVEEAPTRKRTDDESD